MILAPGTTSFTGLRVQLVDDSGLPLTGKVAADFPNVYYSTGTNTAAVQITLSDLAAITSAYSSGGVKEDTGSDGVYRLDLPNAALATGNRNVRVFGEASGKHVLAPAIDVQYVQCDVRSWKGSSGGILLSSSQDLPVVATGAWADLVGSNEFALQFTGTIPELLQVAVPAMPTAAQVATAVWEDHVVGTGTGAGGDFDVGGTIGYQLANFVNTGAKQTGDAYPTAVAVKAKTDNLPASPASTGDVTGVWTTAMAEGYAADGAAPTPVQALYEILQFLEERSISGTTLTVKKRDGATVAMTFSLDSATVPTSQTRIG